MKMITKEKAHEIAENYLKQRKRKFTTICNPEKIIYEQDKEINHGRLKGKLENIYVVNYGVMWGNEERSSFVIISADTGEVLYSMNSHGWIEELEDN